MIVDLFIYGKNSAITAWMQPIQSDIRNNINTQLLQALIINNNTKFNQLQIIDNWHKRNNSRFDN